MSQYEFLFTQRWFSKYRVLNYIDYNKARALQELKEYCGFEYYGRKHHENLLTRFIQEYYFYKKFGVDKRTSHLSSMIISGQLTRDEALELMKEPLLDETTLESDINMILNNLGISRDEFEMIMKEPPKQHTDYRTSKFEYFLKLLRVISYGGRLVKKSFSKS